MNDTRNDILNSCLKYFLQHGIRKMSNEKLVSLLGISTKTVYKHFKNKEKLLEAVLHLYHDQKYELLQNLPKGQDAVCLLFDIWRMALETEPNTGKTFFQDLGYYYPRLSRKVELSISKKFSGKFIEIIEQGIEEGVIRDDINPEVVLEGIYALYVSIARSQQYKDVQVPLIELMINTIGVYFRGFCTEAGIESLDEHMKKVRASYNHQPPRKKREAIHS